MHIDLRSKVCLTENAFGEMTKAILVTAVLWVVAVSAIADQHDNSTSRGKVVYSFKEYPYKESSKNENTYREYETACEHTPAGNSAVGPAKASRVRECMSPSCYLEIYGSDPLEEGEIDVRLQSFKGCFTQRITRTRS